MSRNIRLIYIIKGLKCFMFGVPITFLFYNSLWLGTTELFLLQTIFAVSVVFLEIPTGFISDKYSRKTSILIWLIIWMVGFGRYGFSTEFWHIAIAEVLLALWFCCISGTDTALLYDSLQAVWEEKNYKQKSGRLASVASFAEAIGGILAGFIWYISLRYPFLLDAVCAGIALLVWLFLIEPPRTRLSHHESSRKQIIEICRYTYHHRCLFRLIIFSGLVGTITLSMVWFSQPFMQHVWLPTQYVGIYWCLANVSVWVFSLFVHKLEQRLGEIRFMYFLIFFSFICLASIAIFPILPMLGVFLLFGVVRGGSRLVTSDNLHLITNSDRRATVQSINSMFFRLCFSVFWPLFWFISAVYGLQIGIMTLAVLLCSASVFVIYQFQQEKAQI